MSTDGNTTLTSRFVETVTTTAERLELRDGEVEGLELLVGRGGSKTFRLRYRRVSDRKKMAITLGRFDRDADVVSADTSPAVSTRISLRGARLLAKRILSQVALGADPASGLQARRTAPTFNEVADEWLSRHAKPNKRPRVVRDDTSMLVRHVRPAIGHIRANEVTKRDVIRLLDVVAQKPDARDPSGTRTMTHRPNRVFELVRSIFRWALSRDLITSDPTYGLSPPVKKERPRERDLSMDEIGRLWTALDKAPVRRPAKRGSNDFPMIRSTAIALKLALVTGQRIGEVTSIALQDLAFTGETPIWTIPGERSKNGQPNRVPLSPLACQLIEDARTLAGDSQWLFPSPTGKAPIDPHAPTKALERARDKIDVAHFRVHDLRRTADSRMAELGVNPHTISLILNHVSARHASITSKVYVQYSYDKEKREALCVWARTLGTHMFC